MKFWEVIDYINSFQYRRSINYILYILKEDSTVVNWWSPFGTSQFQGCKVTLHGLWKSFWFFSWHKLKKLNCKGTQNTTTPGAPAQPEWRLRNTVYGNHKKSMLTSVPYYFSTNEHIHYNFHVPVKIQKHFLSNIVSRLQVLKFHQDLSGHQSSVGLEYPNYYIDYLDQCMLLFGVTHCNNYSTRM